MTQDQFTREDEDTADLIAGKARLGDVAARRLLGEAMSRATQSPRRRMRRWWAAAAGVTAVALVLIILLRPRADSVAQRTQLFTEPFPREQKPAARLDRVVEAQLTLLHAHPWSRRHK
jgi:hypothetical protein